jgi:hypothetical protein
MRATHVLADKIVSSKVGFFFFFFPEEGMEHVIRIGLPMIWDLTGWACLPGIVLCHPIDLSNATTVDSWTISMQMRLP